MKFSGKFNSHLKEVIRNNFTSFREDNLGHLQCIQNREELLLKKKSTIPAIQSTDFVLKMSQTLPRLNSSKVQVYSPNWKNSHVPHISYGVLHISN